MCWQIANLRSWIFLFWFNPSFWYGQQCGLLKIAWQTFVWQVQHCPSILGLLKKKESWQQKRKKLLSRRTTQGGVVNFLSLFSQGWHERRFRERERERERESRGGGGGREEYACTDRHACTRDSDITMHVHACTTDHPRLFASTQHGFIHKNNWHKYQQELW